MLEGIQGVSTFAADIERANIVIYSICAFLFVVTIGTMFLFIFKYNAKKHKPEQTENIKHHTGLEITWTVIPFIMLMFAFYYGMDSLRAQRTFPTEGLNVKVFAKKWSWSYEYENGKKTSELYVPVDTNVILTMTAPKTDVIHNFYVPAFETKEDVIPGKITKMWFNATRKGSYDVECAEYCGTGHSFMFSKVHVIDENEYNDWYNSEASKPGEKISKHKGLIALENNGCLGCHSLDGSPLVGPSFKNIVGEEVTLADGSVIVRDKEYLVAAINEPNKHIVNGYQAIMPPSNLGDEDIKDIIDYLDNGDKKTIDAMGVLAQKGCLGCHSTNGSTMVGPTFKGIFNRKVMINGSEITSDREYLIESINNPDVKIVDGFNAGIMPSYDGQFTDEEMEAVIKLFESGL